LRRLSSSITGTNAGSPGYLPLWLDIMHTPSAFNVSIAYAISFSAPATSGSGSAAKNPKRPL
jgi:hypothetical protein